MLHFVQLKMTKRIYFLLFAANDIGLIIMPFMNHSKDVIVRHEQNGLVVFLMNVPSQHK
jgi:hypothetical protein